MTQSDQWLFIFAMEFQEPPQTAAGERRKLFTDAQNWLSNTIAKVAMETACQRPKQVGLVKQTTLCRSTFLNNNAFQ